MLYANIDGEKTKATKSARGTCPHCGNKVIAKCGEIITHHWAHESLEICDSWGEGETEWHRGWKKKFPKEWCEVSITKDSKRHQADILTNYGMVLELQHSPINPETIKEREEFYTSIENQSWYKDVHYTHQYQLDKGKMIWLFDATNLGDRLSFEFSFDEVNGHYIKFSWKHFKKSFLSTTVPVFLDLGEGWVFRVIKFARPTDKHWDKSTKGYGYPMRYECFIAMVRFSGLFRSICDDDDCGHCADKNDFDCDYCQSKDGLNDSEVLYHHQCVKREAVLELADETDKSVLRGLTLTDMDSYFYICVFLGLQCLDGFYSEFTSVNICFLSAYIRDGESPSIVSKCSLCAIWDITGRWKSVGLFRLGKYGLWKCFQRMFMKDLAHISWIDKPQTM